MATISASPGVRGVSLGRLARGIIGGLAGGVVFGILMQAMNMIPMVAMLVNSRSLVVGWIVHLAISAFIGATFAVIFGGRGSRMGTTLVLGVGYGVVWWVLGALLIMPARLGMDVLVFDSMAWLSLMGHVLYGLVLGGVFALLTRRAIPSR